MGHCLIKGQSLRARHGQNWFRPIWVARSWFCCNAFNAYYYFKFPKENIQIVLKRLLKDLNGIRHQNICLQIFVFILYFKLSAMHKKPKQHAK